MVSYSCFLKSGCSCLSLMMGGYSCLTMMKADCSCSNLTMTVCCSCSMTMDGCSCCFVTSCLTVQDGLNLLCCCLMPKDVCTQSLSAADGCCSASCMSCSRWRLLQRDRFVLGLRVLMPTPYLLLPSLWKCARWLLCGLL